MSLKDKIWQYIQAIIVMSAIRLEKTEQSKVNQEILGVFLMYFIKILLTNFGKPTIPTKP